MILDAWLVAGLTVAVFVVALWLVSLLLGMVDAAIGEVIWIDNMETAGRRWPTPLPAVVVHRASGGVGILLSRPVPKVLVQGDPVATRA